MKNRAKRFGALLEEERFFEAHEVLEEIWFPRRFEKTPYIQLLRGCINAAVSFELLKRGRKEAAKKVYKNFLKYKKNIDLVDNAHQDAMHLCLSMIEKTQERLYNSKK